MAFPVKLHAPREQVIAMAQTIAHKIVFYGQPMDMDGVQYIVNLMTRGISGYAGWCPYWILCLCPRMQ